MTARCGIALRATAVGGSERLPAHLRIATPIDSSLELQASRPEHAPTGELAGAGMVSPPWACAVAVVDFGFSRRWC